MIEGCMPRAILFTGAGANASLNLPTTLKLFKEIYEKHPFEENELFNTISELHDVKDIENVYTILERIEKMNLQDEFRFYSGHLSYQAHDKISHWSSLIGKAKTLRQQIQDYIFDKYSLPTSENPKIKPLYHEIMFYLTRINAEGENCEISIFSLNYDRVVDEVGEEYRSEGFSFIDGFRGEHPQSYRARKWTPEEFALDKGRNIKLFQLHGSLRWRKNHTGLPVKFPSERNDRQDKNYPGELLIYPGSDKEIKEEPYQTMFNHLEKCLTSSKILIIVGYAFRDNYVNRIVADALFKNEDLDVFVISPTAQQDFITSQTMNRISREKEIMKHVLFIEKKFEEFRVENLLEKLKEREDSE